MINGSISHKKFTFPAGEIHVVLELKDNRSYEPLVNVLWDFKGSEEIIELMLYCNAISEAGYVLNQLTIPYFPFSRQDRVAVRGDAFSLKVMCNIINSLHPKKVITYDPHSDVLVALVDNLRVVKQEDFFAPMINAMKTKISLISPDGGSLKKIYSLAKQITTPVEVIECSKSRDPKTGDIKQTNVIAEKGHLNGCTCVIVDDIADGGKTFIEIAKVIRDFHTPKKIILMVTHGIFSKGTKVFEGLIDELYTYKGRYPFDSSMQETMEKRSV